MQILTNGTCFLYATQTSSDAGLARWEYGPVLGRLDSLDSRLWWGYFAAGDHLELSVETPGAPASVELLDAFFQPLAHLDLGSGGGVVRHTLSSYGVVHLRFRGDLEAEFGFRLVQQRGPVTEKRRGPLSRMVARVFGNTLELGRI